MVWFEEVDRGSRGLAMIDLLGYFLESELVSTLESCGCSLAVLRGGESRGERGAGWGISFLERGSKLGGGRKGGGQGLKMILSFSAVFGGQYAVVDLWVNILNVMKYIIVMI